MPRRLILLACALVLAVPAGGQVDSLLERLEPQGYVSDFAGVMGGTREQTERLLAELEQQTGAQVAVVSLPSLEGGEAADFINRLFERWGIGRTETDDGVMLLAAIEDRQVRIEVGYGLEPLITDGLAGQILDERVVPFFREDRYGEGLASGAAAIAATIAADRGVELTGTGAPPVRLVEERPPSFLGMIVRVGFFLLIALLFIRNPWLALLLLSSGHRGGGNFGGGGFGRGGGGFGGFGGGMSGGGGAGRSW